MRSELRMVVALGLAVAAWLWFVPTASSIGTSCGVPFVVTSEDGSVGPAREPDCAARNDTRVLQGAVTALGSVAVLGIGAVIVARRNAERPDAALDPSRSHWEDA